jgi:cold shock CspA family protein
VTDFAPGIAPDPGLLRSHAGIVASFSLDEGIGTIADEDGTLHPFHCTAIFDGSRRIDEGTAVRFVLLPGQLGTLEARDVVPTGTSATPDGRSDDTGG